MKDKMVVRSHDVNIDKEYTQWIAELKVRYRSAQAKAAVRFNAEQLVFNWELGRDLVIKKAEQRWGAGVVEQVKALFYILKTIDGNWSRDTLMNCIKADLYHTQGGAITNFSEQLPAPQSAFACWKKS